jgi:probable F420-dependent oxidoreductase
MRLGVMYPGDELLIDADGLDRWIAALERAGFDHAIFGDHVLGVDPALAEPGWDEHWPAAGGGAPAYTLRNTFRDPLVLFGYLAARCSLELVTGVLVLPQRPAALVAKQAADVDLLSRGRLRLAVGLGWNRAEYQALGVDFATRGRRMDEQIALMRRLWTEETVTFHGEFHDVVGAGVMLLPIQRPIPLWVGAGSARGFDRAGRLGDGCLLPASVRPDDGTLEAARRLITRAALAAGRDPDAIELEGRVAVGTHGTALTETLRIVDGWSAAAVGHVYIDTRYAGRRTLEEHIEGIERAGEALVTRPGAW